jgi:RNA polymerase sigma-70 factor (ECF subfamily)
MEPTRTSLIRRVRDHQDAQSWGEFVALYEPLIHSYARKHGLSEANAQDVVQNVFISLLRALPRFELDHSRGRFRTWLYRITMNAVIDFQKKQPRWSALEADGSEPGPGAPSHVDQMLEEWETDCRRRVLEFVLEKVRGQAVPTTWTCFERLTLQGRKGADIAAELGLTANAVYVNAKRIMDRVKALCAEYLEEEGDE